MLKLGEDEIIIKTFRKHWFIPAIQTIVTSILFFLPIILLFFVFNSNFSAAFVDVDFSVEKPSVLVFFVSLWGLLLWLRFFSFWSDHHLDGWILTNKRVIDVEQRGFFRRDIASFRLERIQDVTTEVRGILATILKFGEVHVQTAGTDREFVLKNATNPKYIKEVILKEHDRIIDSGEFKDKDSVGSPK